ncbi:hypothetical protein M1N24_01105 [Dehalococcoidia bacterium]|nr:hypothetical protein [Dehalococcoidia bacterium]
MRLNAIAILLLLTSLILLAGCSNAPTPISIPTAPPAPDIEATVEAKVKAALTAVPTATSTPILIPTASPTPIVTTPGIDPTREEHDEAFWNKPMWDVLTKCTTDFGFSHQLVAPKDIMQIMFGPGGHVWPHEHMTYWAVAGEMAVVQLYAPADIFRIDVRTGSLSDLEEDPYTEWGGDLYLCDGHTLVLGHIAEPSDVILAILADAEPECDGDHFVGCRWNTETFIPAGTPIFKTSRYLGVFDVGLQMVGLTAEQLQEQPGYGYSITPWRTPGGNAVCSLEYFPEPIRSDYLNLLHSSNCGPFNQDVPGTAMGYWMPSPSPDIFPAGPPSERDVPAEDEIIWLHQTFTESSMHTISVGSTTFGLDFGHYVYTAVSDGLVNIRWDFVKPGHTYCTELQKKINQYMWEEDVERILVTRLSEDGASLTVEATNSYKCGDGPWSFQGGEQTFYR